MPVRKPPLFPLVDDPRSLHLDIGGELHEIKPNDPPSPRGHYSARNGAAELVLNRLTAAPPLWLRLSLGSDFVTDIGVFGLPVAAEKLEACRRQEHLPEAGWLEVRAIPERHREAPLRFSWSVAAVSAPARPIAAARRNGDWDELSAGDYVVSSRCHGEEQRQRVRIIEGETELLTIRCGD